MPRWCTPISWSWCWCFGSQICLSLGVRNERPIGYVACEFVAASAVVALACWQAGYFSVSDGIVAWGFGDFRMNLLSVIDPNGWSYVLPDLPGAPREDEGFNFLGVGYILAVIFAGPALVRGWRDILRVGRKKWLVLLALAGLTSFAVSKTIGIGLVSVKVPLPEEMLQAANIFRSSGRMFWPVFYALLFATSYIIIRGYATKVATYLLASALVIQALDTSAGWRDIRKKLMAEPAAEWETPLREPFWNQAAADNRKVRWIVPQNQPPNWRTIASYAARHGLATDAVYLARVGRRQLSAARERALGALITGSFEQDFLHILDTGSVQAVGPLYRSAHLLARIDGFNVLAPGWKRCGECPPVVDLPKALALEQFMTERVMKYNYRRRGATCHARQSRLLHSNADSRSMPYVGLE